MIVDAAQAIANHLPEAALSGLALLVLILGTLRRPGVDEFLPRLAVASLLLLVLLVDWRPLTLGGEGAFAMYGRFAVILVGIVVLLSYWKDADAEAPGEFLSSILFALAGAMLIVSAEDLIVLFIGLELVSLPTYLLVSLGRRNIESQEAGAKYFFLSILAAAVMLYGFSFLYGVTGTLRLTRTDDKAWSTATAGLADAEFLTAALKRDNAGASELARADKALRAARDAADAADDSIPGQAAVILRKSAGRAGGSLPLLMFGAVLAVVGLCFKLAAVPMHFYAPDVYQGSHPAVAGMMASLPKAAGLFAMLRVAAGALAPLAGDNAGAVSVAWYQLFWWLAAATMTVGNVAALLQHNVKRMLAYSSIAHSGYLLVAVAGLINWPAGAASPQITQNGAAAALFYVLVYAVMTIGAFGVLSMVRTSSGESAETLDDLAGLSRRRPVAALCMAIFMFSLTGLPPTAGFLGKLSLFSSALAGPAEAGAAAGLAGAAGGMYWLVGVAVLNSAISAVYYLGVVGAMYLREPVGRSELTESRPLRFAVGLCAALSVAWGIAPNLFFAMKAAVEAARSPLPSVSAPAADARPAAVAGDRQTPPAAAAAADPDKSAATR